MNPTDMGPAYTVRLRCGGGGLTYSSRRMTKDEAQRFADGTEIILADMSDRDFHAFPSHLGEVRIRVERITAIEVLPGTIARYDGGGLEVVLAPGQLEHR